MKKKASPLKPQRKLTAWEWKALSRGYNLADGHAHQDQSKEYAKIINNLPRLFYEAEKVQQKQIQDKFEKVFFKLAGQKSYKKLPAPLYQTSCSLSIEVIANYLRLTGKSVALVHPTFDNLADILKRHNIQLFALEENFLGDPKRNLKKITADSLFLVCPNNPTGTEITKEHYEDIVNFCKKNKKLLIVDYSFRFYSSFTKWDQYKILKKSGIDFIVLEDTGKTWPTLDIKIGITLASESVYQSLLDITDDFLLNVSPFAFALLSEYMHAEAKNKSTFTPQKIIDANRKKLIRALKDLPLELVNPTSKISVAWIRLPHKWNPSNYCRTLSNHNVHILPGAPFFWDDPKRGKFFIRIALLRPENQFDQAISYFRKITIQYNNSS